MGRSHRYSSERDFRRSGASSRSGQTKPTSSKREVCLYENTKSDYDRDYKNGSQSQTNSQENSSKINNKEQIITSQVLESKKRIEEFYKNSNSITNISKSLNNSIANTKVGISFHRENKRLGSMETPNSDKQTFDHYQPGMVKLGNKWIYPEDEDISEHGTWEHKKRMKEMEITKEKAKQLTEASKGKHHIADFLPSDKLNEFDRKIQQIRGNVQGEGSQNHKTLISGSDDRNTIQSTNKGFMLLKKYGWGEGEGLGVQSQGVTKPISVQQPEPSNAGLGTQQPHAINKEDDEFELYRKKMMMAYKYRPNPLNNPRRQYY
ncbi:hypothetical protein BB560_002918 [Smittium megazygosporum]|uniref:G-patch domain-containing protein n=1 Tax=Smittium megazygosporum TaxID=133381 RepID=A0A2T9ZDE4_9FUNG|nr:hypothetical protein BB560_002918 [Smittium megazygosporum]